MKFLTKSLIVAIALTGGVAIAKEGVQDPTVKARMDLMGVVGKNTKVLGDMANGSAAFDASAAAAAKAALIAAAAEIPAKFETEADDPVAEARPDIWMNWDGFVERATALQTAAEAVDVATLAGIQAGMGAIGGSCRDCHTDFRAKK
jgi:cytochrome c556